MIFKQVLTSIYGKANPAACIPAGINPCGSQTLHPGAKLFKTEAYRRGSGDAEQRLLHIRNPIQVRGSSPSSGEC